MAVATTPNDGGGYEYQFVDTPLDMFVCKICQYPSREPHLSACCGHTFCKSCLETAKKSTTISKACPICRDEEFITFHNKQADRAIRSLHVFCTNKEKGCEWQGEVNDIINHLGNSDGCQFEDVTCSNDCGKCLQRQYLTGHVEDECVRRKVNCQYCHITGEHQFIEGEHKDQCPKFPIACPNKCEANSIPREDIDEHRKMCPLEEVTCPNDCGMTLQQQYLTTHVKMECPRLKVDCQYCHITGEHQFIEGEHKEQCPKFPIACPNKCEVGSVPRDDIEEHIKMCPLELIQCEYHVVGCEERMARKDQKKHNKEKMEEHLSFTTRQLTNTQRDLNTTKQQLATTCQNLTKAEKEHITLAANTDEILAKLETKFQTKITEIETAAQKRITELETKLEQKSKLLEDVLFSDKDLWWKMINSSSSKQKTQQIEQSVSDPNIFWYNTVNYQASKLSSGDQVTSVIVKMSEYAKKKSDGVWWYSDSFYTHHKGYKMCLYVYAGWTTGYMTVYLVLMKGPYDDQLRWPLKGHCEVKLLNQISNSEHHLGNGEYWDDGHKRVPSGERCRYKMWSSHQFISHEHLHKITPTCQYLKDDSIFLQVDYKLD
ncbi:TNF receptor-associated factor 4-like [Dysidea avara]|uniref:TNF receptor-associated factor 4-like n=1 Tax=Dysidea avara TaxID=196820 RepID=UPI0033260521